MADINQFFQMLLLANPQMAMNLQMGNMGNPFMMNPNLMMQMMMRMMGINGANPNNLWAMLSPQPPSPQPTQQPGKSHKYINKSGDSYVNLYIVNGRRLDESKTAGQSGLIDNSVIDVVSVVDIEGA